MTQDDLSQKKGNNTAEAAECQHPQNILPSDALHNHTDLVLIPTNPQLSRVHPYVAVIIAIASVAAGQDQAEDRKTQIS